MRILLIGVFLGLNDFRKEIFFIILYGKYLKMKYFYIEFLYLILRMRFFKGCFEELVDISDIDLV